jgi:hypothetical protein
MKKFLVALMAVFFVVSIVGFACAEDRLKMSGAYRVRFWDRENYSDYSDASNADDQNYFDQRFRMGGTFAVAEGITAEFRFDISEAQWGMGSGVTTKLGGNQPVGGSSAELNVDRAFMRIEKDLYNLVVGQHYVSFGDAILLDQQTWGAVLRFKLPVVIDLTYDMIDENGSLNDSGANADQQVIGAQFSYKADNWNAGLFGAAVLDSGPADNNNFGIGLNGGWSAGMWALKGEADFFGGDTAGLDSAGAQVYLDFQANVMPNLMLGVDGYYAAGYSDATKTQITGISDWGSWTPSDWGTGFNTELNPLNGIGNRTGGTTSANPIYDPSGNGAGVLGIGFYGQWRFYEPLLLKAKYMYLTPSKDSATTLDRVSVFNIGLIYDWYKNTTLRAGFNYTGPSFDAPGDTDSAMALMAKLQITW